ncbi:MAG: universal stress protein [Thermodesulfobacteriota bacterium]
MIHTIVVAYDGSKQSEKAFRFALDMAAKYAATMHVVSVASPGEPAAAVELEEMLDNAKEYFEGHYKCLRELAQAQGIEMASEVRVGHPAEQIILAAEEKQADVIVMGHRGDRIIQRWLVGSVAKRVISHSHCTVVVVR